jgi:hypothetical protein
MTSDAAACGDDSRLGARPPVELRRQRRTRSGSDWHGRRAIDDCVRQTLMDGVTARHAQVNTIQFRAVVFTGM